MLLVPPMLLVACATGYLTPLSLGTLLSTEYRARYINNLCFQSPPFSFLEVWGKEGTRTYFFLKKRS